MPSPIMHEEWHLISKPQIKSRMAKEKLRGSLVSEESESKMSVLKYHFLKLRYQAKGLTRKIYVCVHFAIYTTYVSYNEVQSSSYTIGQKLRV